MNEEEVCLYTITAVRRAGSNSRSGVVSMTQFRHVLHVAAEMYSG